ncbi:MAG: hypothetical protein ABSH33_13065 [Steroidobacteraceae bacterium]
MHGGRGSSASRRCFIGALAALLAVMECVTGCSLISLKSPEKPLSTRDLNARILTREYSAHFISAVGQASDEVASGTADPEIRLDALRWKIAAAGRSLSAANQMAPMMGLLDTWALSVQMSEYFSTGAGQSLFGARQPRATQLAADLASEAEDLARRLLAPDEFAKDRQFIEGYSRAHPIADLHFTRPSIVNAWTQDTGGQTKLVDSLGTVPEALADAGDRLRLYGEAAPEQIVWQAQLAAQASGISTEELRTALRRLDDRLDQVSAMVNATPKLVNGVLRDAGTRLDASWSDVMRDVRAQEATLADAVSAERQAALNALDAERAAVAADAARLANQVVRDAGEQVRRLVREALILVIVLALVVIGVPFGAGYFVGRAHRR